MKIITITAATLSLLLTPQLTYACGGVFSFHYSMLYILFILFILHSFVFYQLHKKLILSTKEVLVKKYSFSLFITHVLLPPIPFIFATLAYACVDTRTDREIFIAGLSTQFLLIALLQGFISAIFYLKIRSKKTISESRIKIGKVVAGCLWLITVISFIYLAHSLLVVAPTINDTPFRIPLYSLQR